MLDAVSIALTEWARGIEDTKNNWPIIDQYIRSEQGLHWSDADLGNALREEYNGKFEWCGAFAAWCFGGAGLRASIRFSHMASCYRLHKWARANGRLIPAAQIQAGDIVVVGPGDNEWGRHITIATGPASAGAIPTVEGNGTGLIPGGSWCRDGVVRNIRPLLDSRRKVYKVQHVVRFREEDFV